MATAIDNINTYLMSIEHLIEDLETDKTPESKVKLIPAARKQQLEAVKLRSGKAGTSRSEYQEGALNHGH